MLRGDRRSTSRIGSTAGASYPQPSVASEIVRRGVAERLTPLDASFLHTETASAHMHVAWRGRFRPDPARPAITLARVQRVADEGDEATMGNRVAFVFISLVGAAADELIRASGARAPLRLVA